MKKRENIILLILSFILLITPAFGKKKAENKMKQISTYVKSGSNLDDALKLVETCAKDSLYNLNPELYQDGMLLSIKMNDAENEKAYLKQKYDTIRFFKSIYNIFDYARRCDSVETVLNKEKGKKYSFRSKNIPVLQRYFKNLGVGGRYFYAKDKYDEAEKMLCTFISTYQSPLMDAKEKGRLTHLLPNTAYLCLKSNFQLKRYKEVYAYADLAVQDTAHHDAALEYLSEASRQLKDTTKFKEYLLKGLQLYPKNSYYYSNVSGILLQKGRADDVLALSDSLLKLRPNNQLYILGKSLALINLKRYTESIACSKELITMDSTTVEPFYNIGLCYCNMAQEIELPTKVYSPEYKQAIVSVQNNYRLALPYMELYRKMRPHDETRWAPLLYRIYLNLNMGKQFDEISTLLSTKK